MKFFLFVTMGEYRKLQKELLEAQESAVMNSIKRSRMERNYRDVLNQIDIRINMLRRDYGDVADAVFGDWVRGGIPVFEYFRRKHIGDSQLGKKLSRTTRRKISIGNKIAHKKRRKSGYKLSAATRRKMSLARRGRKFPRSITVKTKDTEYDVPTHIFLNNNQK